MRRVLVSTCLAACLSVFCSGIAAGLPPIQRNTLDNGLVLLVSEEHSLPFVTFHVLVKTGSKDDPSGLEGLASLTADCLLLGAGGRTLRQIHEDLDFMGARIGTAASKDFTNVSLTVLKKDVDRSLPILMDILSRPTFPAKEVKKEISRALGAIQSSEDQPAVVAERAFNKSLYGEGPYGHPTEGTKTSVSKITREQLSRFHRAHFLPNNSVLAVVGDIDQRALKERIVPALEKWSKGPVPGEHPETAFNERKQMVKIDRPVTQANIVMGNVGMARENPDYYAAMVMNYILGGGSLSSRLMDDIRNKKGLAYSVGSLFAAQKRTGSFQVILQTKAASTTEAIGAVNNEIVRIRKDLVSEQELDDAKKYLVGSFSQRFSTQSRIAAFFGQVEYYGLGLDYPEKYRELINAVTREDVLRVAQKYLHPDVLITVVVADLKAADLDGRKDGVP
jgi:zinc protease